MQMHIAEILLSKGNKDQRPFSEQVCSLTIASREMEICVLFHSPIIYQAPCPVAVFNFTAWRPKAPGSSFALESIDLAASPASVPLVGTVNHVGSSIDLPSSVFISIPGSVLFLDPSVCLGLDFGQRGRLSDEICASWAPGSLGFWKQQGV